MKDIIKKQVAIELIILLVGASLCVGAVTFIAKNADKDEITKTQVEDMERKEKLMNLSALKKLMICQNMKPFCWL